MPRWESPHPPSAEVAKSWIRALLAFALLILAISLPDLARLPQPVPSRAIATPTPPTAPTVLTERLDWAMARFEVVGLELPTVSVSFHSDLSPCDGHRGLFRGLTDVARIAVCDPTRHIILHELAHAWLAYTTGDTTKAALLEYWELETWSDPSVDWTERGSEKAATALAFSLGDLPADPSSSLLRYLCSYELITGKPFPQASFALVCD